MTVTEASPDVRAGDAAETEPAPRAGLAALVGSGDPRSIGKLFVGTSLLFFLAAGVVGVLVGLETIDPASFDIVGAGSFAQLVTLHQLGALFLVIMPLLLGLALVVVPLQVGASTVAFPRATAAAYWTYLVAGGIVIASYIADGGPWGPDVDAVRLFVVAFIALLVALCTVTISVATTVLALRAPGMTLRRTPLFAWSMVVAGTIWLLTLPILAVLLGLYYFDVSYGEQQLFTAGTADLYDQMRWVFWQPALYAFAIPALGIIGDIVPVFAQRRHYRHTAALILIGLFGALGFGAWTQIAVLPTSGVADVAPDDIPWLYDGAWVAVGIAAVLPVLGLLGLWTMTLLKGRIRLDGPLLLAQAAGLLILIGVTAGVGTVISDLELVGTTWMTGQAYAVLVGTTVAALAGLIYWAPKLYGKLVGNGVAKAAAPLFVLGGLLLAVPYAVAGLLNQRWWVETWIDYGNEVDEESTVEVLNGIAAAGGVLVVLAGALVILALLRTTSARVAAADDDPWDGHTLEWTTASPPPVGNFAEVMEITSEAPLYDKRHAEAGAALPPSTEEVSA